MMKLGKKILVAFLLLVSCFLPVQAFDVPESKENFYVADYVGVISDEHAEEIREINAHLESTNGSQIVVAVFDFLNGEDIADVAAQCFNEWQIGSAEEDNGILLLLAIGEENYYCVQGKGLEYQVSSSYLDDTLYEYLEPDFAVENYSEGVIKTVRQLAEKLEKLNGTAYEDNETENQEIADPETEGHETTDHLHGMMNFTARMLNLLIVVTVILVMIFLIRFLLFSPRRRYSSYSGPHYYGRPSRRTDSYSRPSSSFRPSSSSRPSRPSRPSSSSRSSSRNRGGGGRTRGGGAGRRK